MKEQQVNSLVTRELPFEVVDNVWMWSVFSEEKGFYFNGYALKTERALLIVDPPTAMPEVFEAIDGLGRPTLIIITNRDHERSAEAFETRYQVPIAIHQADQPLVSLNAGLVLSDQDTIADVFTVIHLSDQKSPGEVALYSAQHQLLILGDALICKTPGQLSMLPEDKYADKSKAYQSLRRLLDIQDRVNIILVGDGEPILENGGAVLQSFFEQNKS
jgi:glyoxylase-like metal-dependent hydrolase (beta-lactamase superfamily II)